MEAIDLSIVIVCYHSDEFIFDAVHSIFKYNDIDENRLEIIIVDNSPVEYAEQSFSKLRGIFGEKLVLIHNTYNGGYGQGNNLGIDKARGKLICIMNPDVNFVQPVFARVIRTFEHSRKLALLGGKQLGHMDISFYFKPEFEFLLLTGVLTILLNRFNFYHSKLMYLSGALLFIDKKKLEEAGRFDEKIFLYVEEPDVTHRLAALGYTSRYDKHIPYYHLIDGRTDVSDGGFAVMMQSTEYYCHKFKLNFQWFIRQKVISYRIMEAVYGVLNRKSKRMAAKANRQRHQPWQNR